MPDNKPRSREKNTVSGGKGVHIKNTELGTGPVGQGSAGFGGSGKKISRGAAAGGGVSVIAVIAVLLMKMLGGTADTGSSYDYPDTPADTGNAPAYTQSAPGNADNTVASGSREKYTKLLGNNQDTVTIMVYMCGTDLESKYGIASSDMQEMAAASYGNNVNIICFTGGCKQWKTGGISNSVNQIYRIAGGKLEQLEGDMGSKPMTDPDNLSSFIKYCAEKYPASRNELILWDHGGGSVSGYGYDEKNSSAGSMDLSGISKALKNGGVKFDFVGFDACLMATAETALMLNEYADYMIASEETEPGIGWYYTDWLNALGKDTSMPTVDIGRNIVDGFVEKCAQKCPGQGTTLSVTDLAEFANTVPEKLTAFSKSVSAKISEKDYKSVSDARYSTREYARSSKIDQVDLAHLSLNLGTSEGKELADAIRGAVKYNRTSPNMSNSYGISIYFPYRRTSYVDKACSTYSDIGMNSEYSNAIRQFASLETSGQIAAGGTGSPVASLLGLAAGSSSSGSADVIGELLSAFMAGASDRSIEGLDSGNTSFMNENILSEDQTAEYISQNYFDISSLEWSKNGERYTMDIPKDQWELIHELDINMYYDNGEGYVDLGYDNIFSTEGDTLIADTEGSWLSINDQPVAYYHTDTVEDGDNYRISGYVPVFYNGERALLMLAFDNENPNGYAAGISFDYANGETDTSPKIMTDLSDGDTLAFISDYYTYDGDYIGSYQLGDDLTVNGELTINNTMVGDGKIRILYRFTDIYNNRFWTDAIILS